MIFNYSLFGYTLRLLVRFLLVELHCTFHNIPVQPKATVKIYQHHQDARLTQNFNPKPKPIQMCPSKKVFSSASFSKKAPLKINQSKRQKKCQHIFYSSKKNVSSKKKQTNKMLKSKKKNKSEKYIVAFLSKLRRKQKPNQQTGCIQRSLTQAQTEC